MAGWLKVPIIRPNPRMLSLIEKPTTAARVPGARFKVDTFNAYTVN